MKHYINNVLCFDEYMTLIFIQRALTMQNMHNIHQFHRPYVHIYTYSLYVLEKNVQLQKQRINQQPKFVGVSDRLDTPISFPFTWANNFKNSDADTYLQTAAISCLDFRIVKSLRVWIQWFHKHTDVHS